jgi:hypothetical protein
MKMMFNRDEICTFLKLKMGIQNITKHNFTQQHLDQARSLLIAFCGAAVLVGIGVIFLLVTFDVLVK